MEIEKKDFFAAHAPNEIPMWFKHDPFEKPKEPKIWSDYSDADPFKNEMKEWHRDGSYDIESEEIKFYQKDWEKYFEDMDKWQQEDNANRFYQWRVHFAERMIFNLYNKK